MRYGPIDRRERPLIDNLMLSLLLRPPLLRRI